MVESLRIETPARANSSLLAAQIAAQVATPFSVACGEDDKGFFVRLTTDTPLGAADVELVRSVIRAHDPTIKTLQQTIVEERSALNGLAELIVTGIDFDALDARIDTITWQEAVRGLYRAIYLLAVQGGLTDNTKQAERAAQELGQYFGLIEQPSKV